MTIDVPPPLKVDVLLHSAADARKWIAAIERWFEMDRSPQAATVTLPPGYRAVLVPDPYPQNKPPEGADAAPDDAGSPATSSLSSPTPGSVGPEAQAGGEHQDPAGALPPDEPPAPDVSPGAGEEHEDRPHDAADVSAPSTADSGGAEIGSPQDSSPAVGLAAVSEDVAGPEGAAAVTGTAAPELDAGPERVAEEPLSRSPVSASIAKAEPEPTGQDAGARSAPETPASPPSPEPDWDALVAECLDGTAVRDVAKRAGVSGNKLGGKVVYAKYHRKRVGNIPDPIPGPPAEPAPDYEDEPSDAWTLDDDIALLTGALAHEPGTKLDFDDLAEFCGRPAADVKSRFKRLCPEWTRASADTALKRLKDAAQAARARECIAKAPATPKPAAKRVANGWDTKRDLELVEGILRIGFGRTIARMGITDVEAKARWNHLLPVKGLDQQAKLLRRLRAEVGQ